MPVWAFLSASSLLVVGLFLRSVTYFSCILSCRGGGCEVLEEGSQGIPVWIKNADSSGKGFFHAKLMFDLIIDGAAWI